MAFARRPELKRLDFQGSRETTAMVALLPERNGIPVHLHLRTIVRRQIASGDALEPAVRDIADVAFCHGARAGCGGLTVDVAASRLKEFSDAIAAIFESGRYFEGLSGSHTIAPLIAEKYRTAHEHAIKNCLAADASCWRLRDQWHEHMALAEADQLHPFSLAGSLHPGQTVLG